MSWTDMKKNFLNSVIEELVQNQSYRRFLNHIEPLLQSEGRLKQAKDNIYKLGAREIGLKITHQRNNIMLKRRQMLTEVFSPVHPMDLLHQGNHSTIEFMAMNSSDKIGIILNMKT
uniref:Uncharacterized protein n=1 Tax=Cacopsylla melanoneura TaxID=428564 RepID=A0A8D8QI11_9HEMI